MKRGIALILLALGFTLVIGGLIPFIQDMKDNYNASSHIEEVNCYDRYGNLIKGVTCEKKVYPNVSSPLEHIASAFVLAVGITILTESITQLAFKHSFFAYQGIV